MVLPVLIFICAVIPGQRPGRAFRSALLIGIGLVIDLLVTQLGPAAAVMAQRFDVGWPSTSVIAFGSRIGAFVILIGLSVNIALLAVGLTPTLDLDLWNYWHIAFTGALVAIITDSILWGFAAAAIQMVPVTLLIAVIVPGNRVLPFGDLATMPFIVCMMVPIFRGSISPLHRGREDRHRRRALHSRLDLAHLCPGSQQRDLRRPGERHPALLAGGQR